MSAVDIRAMTVTQLDAFLASHGVTSLKVIRVAGMVWAMTPRGVGVGADLATAIDAVVTIVKEAATSAVNHDAARARS